MATEAEQDETITTRVEQVTIVSGQLMHARGTHIAVMCIVGALLTFVPQPWAAVAVALFVFSAIELLASKTARR